MREIIIGAIVISILIWLIDWLRHLNTTSKKYKSRKIVLIGNGFRFEGETTQTYLQSLFGTETWDGRITTKDTSIPSVSVTFDMDIETDQVDCDIYYSKQLALYEGIDRFLIMVNGFVVLGDESPLSRVARARKSLSEKL